MQVAFVFTEHQYAHSDWALERSKGSEKNGDTPRPAAMEITLGDSGPVMGNSSLCFLEVLPPKTLFFF